MRVLLASFTYQTYEAEWVTGLSQALVLDDHPRLASRLRDIGAEITFAHSKGYGGGRNAGAVLERALKEGADVLLVAEQDIGYEDRHVVQILEAFHAIHVVEGAPAAVGAMYPMSSDPRMHILAEKEGRTLVDTADPTDRAILRERVHKACAARDNPRSLDRYAEVWQLPWGFLALPVAPFADAPPLVEEGGFRVKPRGFDQSVSKFLRERGIRQYVDLSLDVGHLARVTRSSLQVLEIDR